MIDAGLYIAYGLLLVAAASAVLLPLLSLAKSKKAMMQTGVGLGALLVLFVVSYSISGDEVTASAAALGITPMTSQLIGAGLIMFYIVLVLAVLGLIYSEVKQAISK
jgi:hypothetical protein